LSGAEDPAVEVGLLNPNRYLEAAARVLRPWILAVAGELAPAGESFAVRFCGDREMRRVNLQFRGQDKPTDVLSFPGDSVPESERPGEAPEEEMGHLGDVLISVPTARRQAEANAEGRNIVGLFVDDRRGQLLPKIGEGSEWDRGRTGLSRSHMQA
jgi:rRNA maturation RNase YbeY